MRYLIGFALLLLVAESAQAENWPGWRGPRGDGTSTEKDLPTTWSTKDNVRWKVKLPSRGNSSPIVWGERIFLESAPTGEERRLYCLNAADGKIVWSKEGYINSSADNAYASFLVLGNNILICTDGGELVLIPADPSQCRELGRAQVCGRNWCNPAYAGGRLYVRDGLRTTGNLFCVELLPHPQAR